VNQKIFERKIGILLILVRDNVAILIRVAIRPFLELFATIEMVKYTEIV